MQLHIGSILIKETYLLHFSLQFPRFILLKWLFFSISSIRRAGSESRYSQGLAWYRFNNQSPWYSLMSSPIYPITILFEYAL